MTTKYRVLSISGGGSRGVLPASILLELEEATGQRIHEMFDLVVGTSTGGIIAAGLGKGLSAEDLLIIYLSEMKNIFTRSWAWQLKSGNGFLNAKYDGKGLDKTISQYLGRERYIGDTSKIPFITTAYDTLAGDVLLFKSGDMQEFGYSFADVAIATASAPTFFPPYKLDGRSLIDGGIFANNPLQIAWVEGLKAGYALEDIQIVSLGTGWSHCPFDTNGWGIKEWLVKGHASPLLDMMFSGADQKDSYVTEKLFTNYLSIDTQFAARVPLDETRPDQLQKLAKLGRELFATNKEVIFKLIK